MAEHKWNLLIFFSVAVLLAPWALQCAENRVITKDDCTPKRLGTTIPADYDGISSTVPIVSFSTLMLAPALMRIQEKPLTNWVPATKAKAVAWEFIRQCDNLDGLKDGVINNYAACRRIFNVNQGKASSYTCASPW